MKIYKGGRHSGKTTWAIMESARLNASIVVLSNAKKILVMERAKEMEIEIPEPIVFSAWNRDKGKGSLQSQGIIIDGVQEIFQAVFDREIKAITVNDNEMNGWEEL